MFFVYIIKSIKTSSFYIGYTSDVEKRIYYHNNGLNRSTKNKGPWVLVYKESLVTKTEALKREKFLKAQKNRAFYERLISGCSLDG